MIWHGASVDVNLVNVGKLALIRPVLDQLDIAAIIDRNLPADPQLEYSYGQVLTALLAARLDHPLALMNVAEWANDAGTELMFGIPPEKLNDDRLGRALDALFDARHSITAQVTAEALRWTEMSLKHIHFDPTDITFYGRYESSRPRPSFDEATPEDEDLPPAHLQRGYASGLLTVQLGAVAAIDDFGALPIFTHAYDGNRNGFTGIRETCQLLRQQKLPLANSLLVSDRGTFSANHLGTLRQHDQYALCSVSWRDYQTLYDANRTRLGWQQASFLSQEQQRRRDCQSTRPLDNYRIAVLTHQLQDDAKRTIPCRVIFVHSSANERLERERRTDNIAKVQAGLTELAAKLERAHPCSTPESIQRQIVRLLGKKDAARFFRWSLVALSPEELAALPRPKKGYRLQTHRLEWSFDAATATAAAEHDGLYALITTTPLDLYSGDALFTIFKRQCYLERSHHQLKTPLAVAPVFLKTPKRVEALIFLIHLALVAQQAMERVYRKKMSTATTRDRTTATRLFGKFRHCNVMLEFHPQGVIAHATNLTPEQRQILRTLGLPTIYEFLKSNLPPRPPT
jgi:hypothetical protein